MAKGPEVNRQIDQWFAGVKKQALEKQKSFLEDLHSELVDRNPVGDKAAWAVNIARAKRGLPALPRDYVGGHSKRNWQISFDAPARAELPGVDPSGLRTKREARSKLNLLTKSRSVFLSNPVDYVEALDRGWSRQAPQGFIAQAVAAVTAKYERIR